MEYTSFVGAIHEEAVGELMWGVIPYLINDVGAKHLGDYLSGIPEIFISKCFALVGFVGEGEAFDTKIWVKQQN